MNHAQTIALYQPTLHAIAMRMLRSKADAEDVVQETFMKWLATEHEKIQNTKAYLIKAVTNNCLNHINALKRKKEEYIDSFHWPEFIERIRETEFSNIDIELELSKAFQQLHHKLEPIERAVYVLKEAFDFDYKALQELLDKKQEHCRQIFCRAKKKLEKDPEVALTVSKPTLLASFKKACDFGHASEFVNDLKQELAAVLAKKK